MTVLRLLGLSAGRLAYGGQGEGAAGEGGGERDTHITIREGDSYIIRYITGQGWSRRLAEAGEERSTIIPHPPPPLP